MKFFDAFSGYGGFHLGIERAYEDKSGGESGERTRVSQCIRPIGDSPDSKKQPRKDNSNIAECIGWSEIDKYASAVYKYHFGGKNGDRILQEGQVPKQSDIQNIGDKSDTSSEREREHGNEHTNNSGGNYGDITQIDPTTIPDFDLFCGGFPCQAFSIAGKRLGFAETRGTLIYDVFRILKEKQPRLVLLENVKGLLSHDSGNTFKTIISSLAELGYSVEWQVLNAKNFGVPQNRERVFIIGHLGGFGGRQVFPITRYDEQVAKTEKLPEQVSNTLRTNYSNGRSNETYVGIEQLNNPKHSNDRVYGENGISPTLNTAQGGNRQPFVAPVLTPDRLEKRQNGRRFKTNGEPMFTLNTQDKHGVYDGYKIRRLTPTECERLMGLPDGWTKYGNFDGEIKEISDTQRYKLCGNGVVVNVVEYIIDKLFRIKK